MKSILSCLMVSILLTGCMVTHNHKLPLDRPELPIFKLKSNSSSSERLSAYKDSLDKMTVYSLELEHVNDYLLEEVSRLESKINEIRISNR